MLTKLKDALTDRMDKFADRLLTAAEDAAKLEDKVVVFKAVGQWVAIKHAIRAGDEGGDDLAEYRKRLQGGHADKPCRGFQDDTPEQQRARIMRRWHPDKPASIDGNGGPELEALKARLPKSSDG